jgi:predicted metal-dependent phosphoesterase TrpH
MLIDLHCHTRVYSGCSILTPATLVDAARAAGLDGVCITEHDALWPADEIDRVVREPGFVVLRGVEVSTDVGHVLAYGLPRYYRELTVMPRLQEAARREGALLFLAHPDRRHKPLPNGMGLADIFDSLEVMNGTQSAPQNSLAAHQAASLRLPGIGGSDAHAPSEVGTCATLFERDVRTERELLTELRAGRYRALDLRDRDPQTEEGT